MAGLRKASASWILWWIKSVVRERIHLTATKRGANMVSNIMRQALTSVGTWTSHPTAFLVVAAYAILWAIFDRDTLGWHGVAVLATWMMTLFIQRAEHRDTQAIHAKLDALVKASSRADDSLTKMDHREPEDIEAHRDTNAR